MRNIIFDFNGTLFQDSDMHCRAWKRFMSARGMEITDELFHQYMCGPPNDAILRRFLGEDLSDEEVAKLAGEKEDLYRAIVLGDPSLQVLTDGAPELLDALKARGVPFAIATGSSRDNVDFYFDTLGIGRWFDYGNVFYAEGRLPGKPDPAIYRLAMQKLGFAPQETMVVEDAMPGIESAVGAGIRHIVAIDTTLGSEAFRSVPQVAAVVHNFTDSSLFLDWVLACR